MGPLLHSLFATLVLTVLAAAQQPGRLDQELTLQGAQPGATGKAPSASLTYRVQGQGDGEIFVWAESDDFDPVLKVDSSDGRLQLQNDDDGGGTTAWVRTQVLPGMELKIQVAGKRDSAAGIARLRIREMPHSEATRRAKENAEAAFAEADSFAKEKELLAAREVLEPAVEALIAASGIEYDADAHGTLWRLSEALYSFGDTTVCLKGYEALCRFAPDRYPPFSRAALQPLTTMCGVLAEAGRGEEAMPYCERALSIAQHSFGAGSGEVAMTRFNLGLALSAAHELEPAREAIQSSATDFERLFGPENVTTAMALAALGTVLADVGELDEGRRQGERAVQVMTKLLDPADFRLLAAEGTLASTLNDLGDERAARVIHQHLLAVYSKLYEPDHMLVLQTRHNVAIDMLRLGELEEARAEFEALSLIYRRLGTEANKDADNTDIALCDVYNKLGRYRDALRVVEDRRRIRLAHGQVASSSDWRTPAIGAQALLGMGELERALEQAEASLAAATRALPPENPDLAEVRQVAARLNLKLGRQTRAYELTRQAVNDAQGYLARCATTLSMGQAEAAQAHWSRLVSDGIALLDATAPQAQRAQADALAFELSESARGIGSALLRCAHASSSPGVETLRRKVRDSARALAKLGAGGGDAAPLEGAIAAKESAERELRDALTGLVGPELASARPSAAAVARSLAADEALVAYWRVDTRALDAPLSLPREARLCAFVLRAGRDVRKLDLGPLAPIARATLAWRAAIAAVDSEGAARELKAGAELRRLVIDPLQAAVGDATHWRVAPDDALHLVALDALPLESGRLGDKLRIDVSPTATRLSSPGGVAAASGTFLELGGIDYDFQDESGASDVARADSPTPAASARRGDPASADFSALWETQEEIDVLAALYGETHGAEGHVARLSDRDATKSALVAAAAHASSIHIATHGFFALKENSTASASEAALAERSPLALCGLALTGANAKEDDRSEGVITAEELATLDLSGCQLVVLSACDTNVGTLSAGQGVASFQKALHAAGARVVVTSLWKVSDVTTRELMLEFYRGMWADKLSPEDALWRAKLGRIARRAPVRDWAGWVLSRQ